MIAAGVKGNPHTRRVQDVLDALTSANIFAWKNSTGVATSKAFGRKPKCIRYGYKGSSDIFAIAFPAGRFVGIEIKTGKGKLEPDQEAFRDRLMASGAAFFVVDDRSSIDALVERVLTIGML